MWCTYCKKSRHIKERCWKLHCKPPSKEWGYRGGQQKNQGQANLTKNKSSQEKPREHSELNKEEIDRLRGLLGSLEKPSGVCSLALLGNFFNSYVLNVSDKPIWNSRIIDSGATDHMTHSSLNFSTYIPCPSNQKVAIVDDSLTTVASLGDIHINPSLTLKNVLHVPKLSTNLVSIQKLLVR